MLQKKLLILLLLIKKDIKHNDYKCNNNSNHVTTNG